MPPSRHWYKYRLYYGAAGRTHVRYDNERGKGDHRHLGDGEEANVFSTVEQSLAGLAQALHRARAKSCGAANKSYGTRLESRRT
ncbi:MAG TPA: DUF6516 family protein [Thermoanaerobaculia bacterium]|nr:DUF6516 family protein [Thermoanaerobaculia bacterium]